MNTNSTNKDVRDSVETSVRNSVGNSGEDQIYEYKFD
jgi:hypothetical protein